MDAVGWQKLVPSFGATLGCDFRQGRENEPALVVPGVRQREQRIVDVDVVIDDQVDVEGTRSPVHHSLAQCERFDVSAPAQQCIGVERGVEGDDHVEVCVLPIGTAHRVGLVHL